MPQWWEKFWSDHATDVIDVAYKVVLLFVVLLVARFAAGAVRRAVRRSAERYARADATLLPILTGASGYAVYAVAGVIALDIFGVNTTSIVALLGAAGLAVGLALKDTLGNIAASIMLLILRPFKVDEFIKFGDVSGTVNSIGLFTTTMTTVEGQYVSAPNGVLWGTTIVNYTRHPNRRMDLIVGVSYDDDLDAGYRALKKIADEDERFMDDPAPQIMVQALGDSSVNLQLRAWTHIDDFWDTWWQSQRKLKEAVESEGLTIPFPQRDVHHYRTEDAPDAPAARAAS